MKRIWVLVCCLFLVFSVGFACAESTDEIIIVDNDSATIKILGFNKNGSSFEMKIYAENKTDSNMMFSIDNASINGVSYDPFWAKEVAAGKKAKDDISWSNLKSHGIKKDATIVSGTFRAYDNDDWGKDAYVREKFTVYPLGESSAAIEVRESEPGDIVIVDNEYCTIIVTGVGPDSDGWYGCVMDLYLVNKTDDSMMVGIEDVSVDGYMCDPYWAAEVPAKCQEYSRIEWSKNKLTESGIDDISSIGEIELKFRVYNSDDWFMDPYYEETTNIKVS